MILYFVSETGHAALVLVDEGNAVGGRIGSLGEEHALVALRLFVLADAAGLGRRTCQRVKSVEGKRCRGARTLGFVVSVEVGAGVAAAGGSRNHR
jgi:hypothetical protein